MHLTPEEKATLASYDQHASFWAEKHNTKNFWLEEFKRFQELLPQGKVLEIGSGGGRDAAILRSTYEYMGTDASRGLLKEAQKRNPGIPFLHQSVYELSFPKHSFDGFWASAVLLHIPKLRIQEALHRIHQCMKPGAVGFISLKEGEGEHLVEEVESEGIYTRFFSFYQEDEFTSELQAAGYTMLEVRRKQAGNTIWLVFFVQTG